MHAINLHIKKNFLNFTDGNDTYGQKQRLPVIQVYCTYVFVEFFFITTYKNWEGMSSLEILDLYVLLEDNSVVTLQKPM